MLRVFGTMGYTVTNAIILWALSSHYYKLREIICLALYGTITARGAICSVGLLLSTLILLGHYLLGTIIIRAHCVGGVLCMWR